VVFLSTFPKMPQNFLTALRPGYNLGLPINTKEYKSLMSLPNVSQLQVISKYIPKLGST
jgi:hypothetical protein